MHETVCSMPGPFLRLRILRNASRLVAACGFLGLLPFSGSFTRDTTAEDSVKRVEHPMRPVAMLAVLGPSAWNLIG